MVPALSYPTTQALRSLRPAAVPQLPRSFTQKRRSVVRQRCAASAALRLGDIAALSAVGSAGPPPPSASAPQAPVAPAPEATSAASQKTVLPQQQQQLLTEDFEDEPTLLESVQAAVQQPLVKGLLIAGGGVLGVTFAIALYKVWVIYNSSRSRRRRAVDKNLVVVEALNTFLPGDRNSLNPGAVRGISTKTGFSKELIFRKYLRYILNERPFDNDAVADILALRAACQLADATVQEVMSEIASRTFKKTGILMRRPKGMTAEGIARKVQGRALFSKLLFLIEMEGLLPEAARDPARLTLLETFGATTEDADAMRIPSLVEMDAEALDRMWLAGGKGGEEAAEGEAPPGAAPAAAEVFDSQDDDA